jgi:hypothetical protein
MAPMTDAQRGVAHIPFFVLLQHNDAQAVTVSAGLA